MTGRENHKSSRNRGLVHALVGTALAALPLGGLVCFLELTRPASVSSHDLHVAALSSSIGETGLSGKAAAIMPVVHFRGVSAELSAPQSTDSAQSFSASDAERVFASLSSSALAPGFESEFVSKEGRRMAVRIVSRDPAGDQIIPDHEQLMVATPASTSKLVSFVWGPWLYRAELEDKGVDAEIVVQKVL